MITSGQHCNTVNRLLDGVGLDYRIRDKLLKFVSVHFCFSRSRCGGVHSFIYTVDIP